MFDRLSKGDLVVLIQSSNFRLNDFRLRLNLFNRGLAVIEHMHLYRNPEASWPVYIDSLAYDLGYLTRQSNSIATALSNANSLAINYKSDTCLVNGHLEIPKLNIGQYDNMANIGGTYPIGEVFTEAQNLANMNGRVWIYAFANSEFEVELAPEPFWLEVVAGIITTWSPKTPTSFVEVLSKVQLSEDLLIRELGFGINQAISKDPKLLIKDITAFERVCGMHMSIGHKHSVYKKSGLVTHKARYHIDVFVQADEIKTDKIVIWKDGKYPHY
jgi:aminopeptidase